VNLTYLWEAEHTALIACGWRAEQTKRLWSSIWTGYLAFGTRLVRRRFPLGISQTKVWKISSAILDASGVYFLAMLDWQCSTACADAMIPASRTALFLIIAHAPWLPTICLRWHHTSCLATPALRRLDLRTSSQRGWHTCYETVRLVRSLGGRFALLRIALAQSLRGLRWQFSKARDRGRRLALAAPLRSSRQRARYHHQWWWRRQPHRQPGP